MDFQSRKSTRKSKDAELQNGFLTRVTARLLVELKFLRVATCIPIDSLFLHALALDLLRFCWVRQTLSRILKHPAAASDSIDGEYVEQMRGSNALAAMELTDDAPSATGTSLQLNMKVVRISEGEFGRRPKDRGCLKGGVSTKNEQDAQGAA
jgi:hypothetical protein